MQITYEPIGIITSPHKQMEGIPIQSRGATGIRGSITIYPPFLEGLQDLEGFSHLILIYHFHLSEGYELQPTPFLDTKPHGVFATRAPRRPNPIGFSIVRLIRIREHVLEIENVDILDGTPLLDIKPYVPQFDIVGVERSGWLENKGENIGEIRSDRRFQSKKD